MAEFLYKAYLSYSHDDEAWARWLHRSLESYRVPAALTGEHPDGRIVPARISPIFRDRDDLPSMADLSEGLQRALSDSESLILICSPSAAQSRWVNEEVRYFQALGRADRVFCVLVDGDPEILAGPGSCFPPALFDGTDDAHAEPLAVDPRRYADGKQLARLKLVAGLLGVRLDDLRRRDLTRRRRQQALIFTSLLGVAVLALLAILARQAEERERQSAEQMASFIVDLGEELKSEIGLEALGLISSRAMAYLEDINPDRLSADTGAKVGLALRQIGQVSDGQGRTGDALAAFARSRDLFDDLSQSYPGQQDLLFELAQAEYYVSEHFYLLGQYDRAFPPARRYAEVSRRLSEFDPENLEWQLELSYAGIGLLAMQIEGAGPYTQEMLSEADSAVNLAQEILSKRPDDLAVISNYSNTLAWAADTRLLACELAQALSERQETLLMAGKALQKAPADNSNRENFAYAHSGVAVVQAQLGELEQARDHWRRSVLTLENLWREDPSNERVKTELQWHRLYLARALLDDQEVDAASAKLDLVLADFGDIESLGEPVIDPKLRLEYLVARARVALKRGRVPAVRQRLTAVLSEYESLDTEDLTPDRWEYLAEIQHLWWLAFKSSPEALNDLDLQQSAGLHSCRAAISNARIALVTGRPALALSELAYLQSKGYRGRDAREICVALGQEACLR